MQPFDKSGDGPGEIERRITVICHAGQPLLHRFPPSLGHRRDHQAIRRMTAVEFVDERCHRHHFTERDGVNPDHWSDLVCLVYLVGPVDKMDQKDLINQTDYFLIPAVEAILDGNVAWLAAPPR